MANLTILDVGHGNCAVLSDDAGCVVIDGGCRQTLLQYLQDHNVSVVDAIIVSHADDDHLGGIVDVLLDKEIEVRKVYLNPDSARSTKLWTAFRTALKGPVESGNTVLHTELSTAINGSLNRDQVIIEILSPSAITAVAGIGGKDLDGEETSVHSMSAAVRVVSTTGSSVFLMGDIDAIALERMSLSSIDLQSNVLVFPHHGGLPGQSDTIEFVMKLCELVKPEMVVFSIGRGMYNNPRREVVDTIRQVIPNVHFACTQLSKSCATDLPECQPGHLCSPNARGYIDRKCCAGTIEIALDSNELCCSPSIADHRQFIQTSAPTALCR